MGDPHVIKKRGKQEEEDFKILFRDNFASMCVFANRYLEDGEMARDVVHDVFCGLWENPSDIHHRYVEWEQENEKEREEFFEIETLREDVYRLLDQAIQLLPERTREILLLKLQGLKNQEIADQLHISVNSVNTLKANAYKVLRDQLHDQYFLSLLFFLKKVCF